MFPAACLRALREESAPNPTDGAEYRQMHRGAKTTSATITNERQQVNSADSSLGLVFSRQKNAAALGNSSVPARAIGAGRAGSPLATLFI
jgi:hypothetical protein